MTSNHVSGNQWDAPFAWAPLQEIAAKGLLNYRSIPGAKEAAVRISTKFVNTIAKDFSKTQSLFENMMLKE
jgi:alpha,alpha-trehalase